MGAAPCLVQPPGTSPPCSGATPGTGLVAARKGWRHGAQPSPGTLRQGRARSVAPRHCDGDNLPAPAGHGWGAPRQQRGGAQHRPRPATTRATSPASAGLCPPPWGCHPAPQCLQHPKTTSCSPARWGTPSASGDTSAGGTQKHIPSTGSPRGPPPSQAPLPPVQLPTRQCPGLEVATRGNPEQEGCPMALLPSPVPTGSITTPRPTGEQGPGTPRAQECPTSSPALSGGETVALGPEPPKRPCPFPPPTVKKLRS